MPCFPAGEGAGLGSLTGQQAGSQKQTLTIDIPFDGKGAITIPAHEAISPVMTMWITLVAMYAGEACCASCCTSLFQWDWGVLGPVLHICHGRLLRPAVCRGVMDPSVVEVLSAAMARYRCQASRLPPGTQLCQVW